MPHGIYDMVYTYIHGIYDTVSIPFLVYGHLSVDCSLVVNKSMLGHIPRKNLDTPHGETPSCYVIYSRFKQSNSSPGLHVTLKFSLKYLDSKFRKFANSLSRTKFRSAY